MSGTPNVSHGRSPVADEKVASSYKTESKDDDYEKQVSLLSGNTNPDNIRIAAHASEIEMDRPTWYRNLRAARCIGLT